MDIQEIFQAYINSINFLLQCETILPSTKNELRYLVNKPIDHMSLVEIQEHYINIDKTIQQANKEMEVIIGLVKLQQGDEEHYEKEEEDIKEEFTRSKLLVEEKEIIKKDLKEFEDWEAAEILESLQYANSEERKENDEESMEENDENNDDREAGDRRSEEEVSEIELDENNEMEEDMS